MDGAVETAPGRRRGTCRVPPRRPAQWTTRRASGRCPATRSAGSRAPSAAVGRQAASVTQRRRHAEGALVAPQPDSAHAEAAGPRTAIQRCQRRPGKARPSLKTRLNLKPSAALVPPRMAERRGPPGLRPSDSPPRFGTACGLVAAAGPSGEGARHCPPPPKPHAEAARDQWGQGGRPGPAPRAPAARLQNQLNAASKWCARGRHSEPVGELGPWGCCKVEGTEEGGRSAPSMASRAAAASSEVPTRARTWQWVCAHAPGRSGAGPAVLKRWGRSGGVVRSGSEESTGAAGTTRRGAAPRGGEPLSHWTRLALHAREALPRCLVAGASWDGRPVRPRAGRAARRVQEAVTVLGDPNHRVRGPSPGPGSVNPRAHCRRVV